MPRNLGEVHYQFVVCFCINLVISEYYLVHFLSGGDEESDDDDDDEEEDSSEESMEMETDAKQKKPAETPKTTVRNIDWLFVIAVSEWYNIHLCQLSVFITDKQTKMYK